MSAAIAPRLGSSLVFRLWLAQQSADVGGSSRQERRFCIGESGRRDFGRQSRAALQSSATSHYDYRTAAVTRAEPDYRTAPGDITPVTPARSRFGVGPYEAVTYLILIGLAAAFATWIYWINIRKLPPFAGSWRVTQVDNIPPMLASTWHEDVPIFVTPDGAMIFQAGAPNWTDRNSIGVITRSIYPCDCYTLSHLNSDWRLSSVSFQVDVSELPSRLIFTGFGGSQILLVRTASGQ